MTSGKPRLGTVLIIGARDGSLGHAIQDKCISLGYETRTAGLYGSGELHVDLRDGTACETLVNLTKPDYVICTAGVNRPAKGLRSIDEPSFMQWLMLSYETNVVGPMNLLRAWAGYLKDTRQSRDATPYQPHFVAISSNSAHIARRNSLAYCASKAALSMAIRCVAREMAGDPCLVYGYEPGLLKGTPMTMKLREQFGDSPTRMHGAPDGVAVPYTADVIARNLRTGGVALNGCLIPLDAGEQ